MTASSPTPDPSPVSLKRDGNSSIVIEWSDGAVTTWTIAKLRASCPCATCREKKRGDDDSDRVSQPVGLPVLSLAEAQPIAIRSMQPVGTYAYNISFSDGHDSGIFTFQLLRNG